MTITHTKLLRSIEKSVFWLIAFSFFAPSLSLSLCLLLCTLEKLRRNITRAIWLFIWQNRSRFLTLWNLLRALFHTRSVFLKYFLVVKSTIWFVFRSFHNFLEKACKKCLYTIFPASVVGRRRRRSICVHFLVINEMKLKHFK